MRCIHARKHNFVRKTIYNTHIFAHTFRNILWKHIAQSSQFYHCNEIIYFKSTLIVWSTLILASIQNKSDNKKMMKTLAPFKRRLAKKKMNNNYETTDKNVRKNYVNWTLFFLQWRKNRTRNYAQFTVWMPLLRKISNKF